NTFEFTSTQRTTFSSHGPINLTQAMAAYAFGKETKHHRFSVDAEVFWSPGHILAHESNHAYHMLRPGAKSRYVYGRLSLSEIYTAPHDFSIRGNLRLQGSNQNLLPSEEFGLGGYDTVRGYKERAINADNALCANFEVRAPSFSVLRWFDVKRAKDELTFLAFIDYGLGASVHRLRNESVTHYLVGVGPGLRYQIDSHLSLRADWGFKWHHTQFGGEGNHKLHFGMVASY
ncbi:MAG: ShlB/FhaC/HecB family hemolysin secretion/activation protein, partial [Anaerolineae bacterium]